MTNAQRRTRLSRAAAVLASSMALGCGPAVEPTTPPPPTPTGATSAAQGNLARYFPLLVGHIYQYETESDGGEGVMMTRVSRADAAGGDLMGPQGTKTFQYAPDGVTLSSGGALAVYVLKAPLTVGHKWRGQEGSWVEIVAVDAAVTVPAGAYTGCVKTLEQRAGDRPLRITTAYCPDVGIVLLEAVSGSVMERVALKSYGPPVDLGPDGVRTLPPDPPDAPAPEDDPDDGPPP